MLKIKIIAVGKIKEPALSELIAEYVKRLGKYCAIDIIEVPDESVSARESEAVITRRRLNEAERILERLRAGAYVIALDIRGESPDSLELSKKIETLTGQYQEIIFIIGGSHGLHRDVLTRSKYILSMSNFTFPHQLARLILLEQLYRSFKILNNETYHK
jgi:23S rRNA (pseudouridine1915-N3)-methyltransferase